MKKFYPKVIMVGIGLMLSVCGRQTAKTLPPTPVISVVHPVAREIVEWDEYIWRLESPETLEVS
jgi:hypothetical protein